jgi:hypothetical protein
VVLGIQRHGGARLGRRGTDLLHVLERDSVVDLLPERRQFDADLGPRGQAGLA